MWNLTPDLLDACTGCGIMPATEWALPLAKAMDLAQVNTDKRVAAFLAQWSYESGGFTRLEEDLEYSAERLLEVWPSRFTAATAPLYAHQPVLLANFVYAGRDGNGDQDSGDGWRFHGRSPGMVTGRANYAALSAFCGTDLEAHPELLAIDCDLGAKAAAGFWLKHGCNVYADEDNDETLTRVINGGLTGLAVRTALRLSALDALAAAGL